MMTELSGLPGGVVGVEASGRLSAEDYRDVLMPIIERTAHAGDVRIVIIIRDFEGVSGGGLWEDTKMGAGHMGSWKRTAVVTDVEWIVNVLGLLGWMTPGEVKHFPLAERDAAIAWAAAGQFDPAP